MESDLSGEIERSLIAITHKKEDTNLKVVPALHALCCTCPVHPQGTLEENALLTANKNAFSMQQEIGDRAESARWATDVYDLARQRGWGRGRTYVFWVSASYPSEDLPKSDPRLSLAEVACRGEGNLPDSSRQDFLCQPSDCINNASLPRRSVFKANSDALFPQVRKCKLSATAEIISVAPSRQ